jgi:uncharacterized membrane protein
MMPNFLYILACLLFTVLGQVLVKKGALELRGATAVFLYVTNIHVILGFTSAGIAAFCWLKALQYYRLSYAYPFMSLSFLIVALLSVVVFSEEVRISQWIGLGIVLVGLWVGSR